jgi:hypothetical protein
MVVQCRKKLRKVEPRISNQEGAWRWIMGSRMGMERRNRVSPSLAERSTLDWADLGRYVKLESGRSGASIHTCF